MVYEDKENNLQTTLYYKLTDQQSYFLLTQNILMH